ncbi:MAG: rod shape-determining protein MreC [Parcubacteria group bacterium]|nr:rod shape-determining protein MreC [Parcubacteria group bacterium]
MKSFFITIVSALFVVALVVYFLPLSTGVFRLASRLPLRAYFYLTLHPREVLSLYEKKNEINNETEEKEHLITSLTEENTILTSALEYKKNAKKKIIMAEVTGYTADPFLKMITIDRGKDAELKEGMPVVDEHGLLLGRVDQVFKDRSFVKQIESPDVEFLVHFEGMGAKNDFIARGMINYVMGTKIQKGDYGDSVPVVTSGLDGKFPPGLLVGEAGTFTLSKDQTFIVSVIKTDNEPKKQVFIITEVAY